jgi:hypothetical protein
MKISNPLLSLSFTALLTVSLSVTAMAKPEKERYPIVGAVSTGIGFNHSNFVSEEKSPEAAALGLQPASGFGWVTARFSTSLSYNYKFSDEYSPIYVSSGLSFSRALSESFSRAGLGTVQPKQFNIQDLSINLGWGLPGFKKISKNMSVNLGLGLTAPFSRPSRSTGLVTALSTSLAVSYRTPIKLALQVSGFFSYNVLENPTILVDCGLMPEYCRVSGEDLGAPNQLMSWGGRFGMQYPLFGGLRIGVSYGMFGGMGAVLFPDSTDAATSPFAQDGEQYGIPFHGSRISLAFGFNQTGSAAQQAMNKSVGSKKKSKKEKSFLDRVNLSLSMSTNQRLYSFDNKRITVPIFDFETNTKSRTSYGFGMQVAF